MVIVTKHAKERMRKRCGINRKSTDRLAKIAYEQGLKHSELNGNLKKWVDKTYFKYELANEIRIYADKAYIFRNSILITILQIPHNIVKEADKSRKSKHKSD